MTPSIPAPPLLLRGALSGRSRPPSLLRHWLDARTPHERQLRIAAVVHELGFDWLSYGRLRRAGDALLPVSLAMVHGDDGWRQRYQATRCAEVDPRVHAALTSSLPVLWDLDWLAAALQLDTDPRQQAFYAALQATGMRSGLMMALPGPRPDERGIVSLLSRAPRAGSDDDTWLARAMLLTACVHTLHASESSRGGADDGEAGAEEGDNGPPLSPTQRAVLRCVASGLADKQIAAQLGLSLHAVDYHMRCLRRRFGVRNRMQLMPRAMQLLQAA